MVGYGASSQVRFESCEALSYAAIGAAVQRCLTSKLLARQVWLAETGGNKVAVKVIDLEKFDGMLVSWFYNIQILSGLSKHCSRLLKSSCQILVSIIL